MRSRNASRTRNEAEADITATPHPGTSVATARRVLIVEDELLIAMVLEDILDLLGCTVAGHATTLAEADALVAANDVDVAVLDVNLGADPVYPLADRLRAAGIGIVFATGSHRSQLPERFADCPVMEKPYAFPAVEAALQALDAA